MVPGVIYGHKQETLSITLSRDALVAAIRHGSRVVDLEPEARRRRRRRSLNCSGTIWARLAARRFPPRFADERIHLTVPIEVRGIAPGVTAGGVLDQPLHALEIECLAVQRAGFDPRQHQRIAAGRGDPCARPDLPPE